MSILVRASLSVVLLLLLPWTGSGAARPRNAGKYVALRSGEYLYAQDDRRLDAAFQDRFGVEFWLYVESVPELPAQQRVILAKPGSYALTIQPYAANATMRNREEFLLPAALRPALYATGLSIKDGYPRQLRTFVAYVTPGEWHHISLDITRGGENWFPTISLDGETRGTGTYCCFERWGDDTSSSFYVGDLPREQIAGLKETNLPYDPLFSSPLYLDELRLWNDRVSPPDPAVRPIVEAGVVALWHFDEGRYATSYRSDGDGNLTLRRSSLSVSGEGRLATTWGALRAELSDRRP